ncbi:MAG: hypothetical protein ACEQSK_19235 [Sphingomonadaceae bacterium]
MGALFWLKRYLLAALPLFLILASVEYYKGSTSQDDYLSAAAWALIAAGGFTWSGFRRYQRNQACALCDNLADKHPKQR